ncbi:hypothetical protein K1X76_04445 [bacterium]|nr:hypothetical protein [bacterium]
MDNNLHSFRLASGSSFLECRVLERDATSHDYLVGVEVSSSGFSAQHELWVERFSVEAFNRDLKILSSSFTGKAFLKGMSPNSFLLSLTPLTKTGYLAVTGNIKKLAYTYNTHFDHEMHFCFECTVTDLEKISL